MPSLRPVLAALRPSLVTLVSLVTVGLAPPALFACGGGTGGFPCDGNPDCGSGAPDEFTDDSSVVDVTVEDVIARGCARFFADCSYLCDSIWYTCAPTQSQCVEDELADRLGDFDHPVVNPALAAECGEQITNAACVDIPPDTLDCDYAVVEGCAVDNDGHGNNYSFLAAVPITERSTTLTIDLCENVEEWFAFELVAGEVLRITSHDPEPTNGDLWFKLYEDLSHLDDEPDQLDFETSNFDSTEEEMGPVDVPGTYYLSFELFDRSLMTASVTVEIISP